MSERQIKVPGSDHPITITPTVGRVVVSVGGRVLADTTDALTFEEAGYRPVQYLPRKDVDMTRLERGPQSTYCPYKGDCAYFSIPEAGARGEAAVWTYESPFEAVAAISGYLAFYPDRVEISVED
jgi:uncharacterized protein (DUF427 family)